MKAPAHRARHPFGKIPTLEEGDLTLFESGAILLHIAERNAGLLPRGADARERAMWLFAALNTIEPPIIEREVFMLMERDKSWYGERPPLLDGRRVEEPPNRPGEPKLLNEFTNLADYVRRGEAPPAYKKAFADQLAVAEKASNRAES